MAHLYAKNPGCGTMDTNRWELQTTIARDTLASNVSHFSRMQYMSTAMSQSTERTRLQMIERMVRPCGPPPRAMYTDEREED